MVSAMEVKSPSAKLVARSNALSSAPCKSLPMGKVRQQVIQHLVEAKAEILKLGKESRTNINSLK